jgi:Ser/Thr protein kinase RdoA (MazF antagonist)
LLIRPFALQMSQLNFIQCSQNDVYLAHRPQGKKGILRISHGRYRQRAEVETELQWISHLAGRDIPVCASILTESGECCSTLEHDGESYIAACFEHAPGEKISPRPPELHSYSRHFEQLGMLVGRMHTEAAPFRQGEPAWPRPHWHESRLLRQDVSAIRHRLSGHFCERLDELIDDLRHHSGLQANDGLIHGDISFNNCFFHEGRPWIFDFDNCEYGCFMQDIATVLYDSIYCKVLNKFADDGMNERMVPLLDAFLAGHSKTGILKEINLDQLKKFFLLREAIIYIHYHRTLDVEQTSRSFKAGMEVMRCNVEAGEHQVDFEYLLNRQKHFAVV